MVIENKNYAGEHFSKRPLMIGCSGGGGHNMAIEAIIQFLIAIYKDNVTLQSYTPQLLKNKPTDAAVRKKIKNGIALMNTPVAGAVIRTILEITPLPILPKTESLQAEMESLSKKQEDKVRQYVDMLLDVYPGGYESVAIWNVLQRNDQVDTLRKLIALQNESDRDNYEVTYKYFLNALITAEQSGTPYTEIISTQAMGLPALCDAVKEYNKDRENQVVIHQYMTDLPTKGAVHFFNVLARLTREQQEQMKLYGVGLSEEIMKDFFPKGNYFDGLYNIEASENPMVRAGFKDKSLDKSNTFHQDTQVDLKEEGLFDIAANEKVASIMLGSQASNDTVEYLESLLENGIDKVFVFGGKNENLRVKINEIIARHPEYIDKIIPLGFMNDTQITPLMTRSNLIITRGGGLSVMEQLAIPHNPEQSILIHHANSVAKNLTSGISWEDENVNKLMSSLREKGIYIQKTCPDRAKRHIAEALLISALKNKNQDMDISLLINHLHTLSSTTLQHCAKWLAADQNDELRNHFSVFLKNESLDTENEPVDAIKYWIACEKLNTKCNDCIAYLNSKIQKELNSYPLSLTAYLKIDDTAHTISVQYDIEKVIKDVNEGHFPSPPSALCEAVKSYKAIEALQETISPESAVSARKKIMHFNATYQDPKISAVLSSFADSKFKQLLREIVYQLAKIIPSMAINAFFSPQQSLRKEVEEFNEEKTHQQMIRVGV